MPLKNILELIKKKLFMLSSADSKQRQIKNRNIFEKKAHDGQTKTQANLSFLRYFFAEILKQKNQKKIHQKQSQPLED